MAKWRGTATAVFYFDAPDKREAQRLFDFSLVEMLADAYRNCDLEEIDEKEYEKEAVEE